MALLNDDIQKQVREALAELEHPVKLLMFTQGEGGALECGMCADTRQLIEEVSALNDKISLEVYDFVGDSALVEQYKIDKIPALAMIGEKDYGIRFFGIPSGYEFSSLIEGLRMVASRQAALLPASIEQLARLDRPVHIQVYVTPT